MFDYENFRKLLRKHRNTLNLTIEQIADKAYLDENNLEKIELGLRNPRPRTIVSILNALNMSFESFNDDNKARIREYHMTEINQDFKKLSERDKKLILAILKI